jgi:chromosome segregation ATPase
MQTPRDKRALRRSEDKDFGGHGMLPNPKLAKRDSVHDGRGALQVALDALKLEYAKTLSKLDAQNEQLSTNGAELQAGQLRQARMLEEQKTLQDQNKNLHEEKRVLESNCFELQTKQKHLQTDIDAKKTEVASLQKAVAEGKKCDNDLQCRQERMKQVDATYEEKARTLQQRESELCSMQQQYNELKTLSTEIETRANYTVSCLCGKVQDIATEYENLISGMESVVSLKCEARKDFEAITREYGFTSQKKKDLLKTIAQKENEALEWTKKVELAEQDFAEGKKRVNAITNEIFEQTSKHEELKRKYGLEIEELEGRKTGLVAIIEEKTKKQRQDEKAAETMQATMDAMSERALQVKDERILLTENWEREMGRKVTQLKSLERDLKALQQRKALLVSDCKEIEQNTTEGLKQNVDRVLDLMKKHNACASLRGQLSSRSFTDSTAFKLACHEILKIRFEECWKSRLRERGFVAANAMSQRVLWHQNGKVYCPVQLARDSFGCQATVTIGQHKATNEKTIWIKNLKTVEGSFFLSAYFYVHSHVDSMFLGDVRAAAKQVNQENLLWGFNDAHVWYADERCQFDIFLAEWNSLKTGGSDQV